MLVQKRNACLTSCFFMGQHVSGVICSAGSVACEGWLGGSLCATHWTHIVCKLYRHCAMNNVQCTKYSAHIAQHIAHCVQWTRTLYNIQCSGGARDHQLELGGQTTVSLTEHTLTPAMQSAPNTPNTQCAPNTPEYQSTTTAVHQYTSESYCTTRSDF